MIVFDKPTAPSGNFRTGSRVPNLSLQSKILAREKSCPRLPPGSFIQIRIPEDFPVESLSNVQQAKNARDSRRRTRKVDARQFDEKIFVDDVDLTGIGLSSEFRMLITGPRDEIASGKLIGLERGRRFFR